MGDITNDPNLISMFLPPPSQDSGQYSQMVTDAKGKPLGQGGDPQKVIAQQLGYPDTDTIGPALESVINECQKLNIILQTWQNTQGQDPVNQQLNNIDPSNPQVPLMQDMLNASQNSIQNGQILGGNNTEGGPQALPSPGPNNLRNNPHVKAVTTAEQKSNPWLEGLVYVQFLEDFMDMLRTMKSAKAEQGNVEVQEMNNAIVVTKDIVKAIMDQAKLQQSLDIASAVGAGVSLGMSIISFAGSAYATTKMSAGIAKRGSVDLPENEANIEEPQNFEIGDTYERGPNGELKLKKSPENQTRIKEQQEETRAFKLMKDAKERLKAKFSKKKEEDNITQKEENVIKRHDEQNKELEKLHEEEKQKLENKKNEELQKKQNEQDKEKIKSEHDKEIEKLDQKHKEERKELFNKQVKEAEDFLDGKETTKPAAKVKREELDAPPRKPTEEQLKGKSLEEQREMKEEYKAKMTAWNEKHVEPYRNMMQTFQGLTAVSQSFSTTITNLASAATDVGKATYEGQKETLQTVRGLMQHTMEKATENFKQDSELIQSLISSLDSIRKGMLDAVASSLRKTA